MVDYPSLPKYSGLEKYFDKAEIIRQTADQVARDFDHFGIAIEYSGNVPNAYEELYQQIYPVISQMLDRHFERLMNILYRIDLNENKVRRQFDLSLEEDFAAFLTHNIIKRELHKVLLRKHFSG